MMLKILNKEELDAWLDKHRAHDLKSIKGNPPKGATFDDGDLIETPVNIAWLDIETNERFDIVYRKMDKEKTDFYSGICVALQVVYTYDNETIWQSIVKAADKQELLQFAKEIEPVNWELCGFHKWFKE